MSKETLSLVCQKLFADVRPPLYPLCQQVHTVIIINSVRMLNESRHSKVAKTRDSGNARIQKLNHNRRQIFTETAPLS